MTLKTKSCFKCRGCVVPHINKLALSTTLALLLSVSWFSLLIHLILHYILKNFFQRKQRSNFPNIQFKNQLKYLIPIACRDVMEHIENEPNEFNKSLTALQQAYHTSIRQTKIEIPHFCSYFSPSHASHPTPSTSGYQILCNCCKNFSSNCTNIFLTLSVTGSRLF